MTPAIFCSTATPVIRSSSGVADEGVGVQQQHHVGPEGMLETGRSGPRDLPAAGNPPAGPSRLCTAPVGGEPGVAVRQSLGQPGPPPTVAITCASR